MSYATQIQSLALTTLATANSFLQPNIHITDLLFPIYTSHHHSDNWRFYLSFNTDPSYLFTYERYHLMDALLTTCSVLLNPKSLKVHPDAIN